MTDALAVVLLGLGLPGLIPALVAARNSPAVVFLAPVLGGVMAAVGAMLELGVGGSLVGWYVVVAGVVNVAAAAWWLATGRHRRRDSVRPVWYLSVVVVVLGFVALPLVGLRSPQIGYDANAVWIPHALLIAGGHSVMAFGLQNVYGNASYPPLLPAAGALAFERFGHGDLVLAVRVTALLNACAVGVVGSGIATAGVTSGTVARRLSIVAAAAFCLVAFAVAGNYAINGYADLFWSAAALGAVVWGLVMPRDGRSLMIAWTCAVAASLTKSEGFTTAIIVIVLIALRYAPPPLHWPKRAQTYPSGRVDTVGVNWRSAPLWMRSAGYVLVPALPGIAWVALMQHLGISNAFFGGGSSESATHRAGSALSGIAGHLVILPVALAVALAGWFWLRKDRQRAGMGNPIWLWVACLSSLAVLVVTYVVGSFEIHWWLQTSVDRTTIFPQLVLYSEVVLWLVVVFVGWSQPTVSGTEVPASSEMERQAQALADSPQ